MKNGKSSDERQTRSGKYQYLIVETRVAEFFFDTIPIKNSLPISDAEVDDFAALDDQIKDYLESLIDKHFTKRQREVLYMHASGMTQIEISKTLQCNQSSIHKAIHGNVDYKGGTKHTYGGITKKMTKLIHNETDTKFKQLLSSIHASWSPGSCYLPFYQAVRALFVTEEEYEAWLSPPIIKQ